MSLIINFILEVVFKVSHPSMTSDGNIWTGFTSFEEYAWVALTSWMDYGSYLTQS